MTDAAALARRHFDADVVSSAPLTGGYTFDTRLLTLSDGRRVVFRTCADFDTGGGRRIVIRDVLEREKFFYDNANERIGPVCPRVCAVGGPAEYGAAYMFYDYIDGAPLDRCFGGLTAKQQREAAYRHGELAASVGMMEIDAGHPYVTSRGRWQDYFADRLSERLKPLITIGMMTARDVDGLADGFRDKQLERTLSFIHLDIRHGNMIYNGGDISLIDAENCEFGDPLFELAVTEMNGYHDEAFAAGYANIAGRRPETDSELFYYYKLERLGLVLHVYLNEVRDASAAAPFVRQFNDVMKKLSSRV